MTAKKICILGATGSVGRAALSVVRRFPRRFSVVALAAEKNESALADLCREFAPSFVALTDEKAARRLRKTLSQESISQNTVTGDGHSPTKTTVAGGGHSPTKFLAKKTTVDNGHSPTESSAKNITVDNGHSPTKSSVKKITVGGGLDSLTTAVGGECDTVIAAMSGVDGVEPLLAAARLGKRILIANKESLIFGGEELTAAAQKSGGLLLPIDSEHCALFDLLADGRPYKKLWLTASGGGARDVPIADLESLSPAQVLRHPTWKMGDKITVDSATMMNKSLEVMEAAILFSCAAKKIGVVIHRQSIVHALLEYADGTMTAHLSRPDMRLPIARMLFFPDEGQLRLPPPDWKQLSGLDFSPPDDARYPCLRLAYFAMAAGAAARVMLSAANDMAVRRFLRGEIKFTDIARINDHVLQKSGDCDGGDLESLRDADSVARRIAAQLKL